MNLSEFHLLKEDSDSYHIKHPKGKDMVIPKKGLNEKSHAAIKKMNKGGVAHYDEGTPDAPVSQEDQIPAALQPTPDAAQSQPMIQNPVLVGGESVSPAQPQQQADQSPQGLLQQKSSGIEQSLEEQKAAKQAEGNALAEQGKKESAAISANDEAISEMPTQQEIIDDNKAKDDALFQAFNNKSIDPNRLWHNASTGSKIAAGIGLFLGGIGSGLTGHPNAAAEMLKNLVDRDIEAQKADQSKAMNAWKMNREALGNDLAANLATQNQMYTALKYKLQGAASQAGSQVALARASEGSALIDQQIAQNRMQISMIQQGMGLTPNAQKGGFSGEDPSVLVPQLIKDPGMQKAAFEEIKNAQLITKNGPEIMKAFDNAAKENTVLRTGAGLLRTPGSVMALHQLMLPNFKTIDGTVRQAAMDESFHNLTPSPGDSEDKIAEKRAALKQWMASESAAPVSKGHGIDVSKFRGTAASSVQGGEEKTRGGVKYAKVQGGWQRVDE